MADSVLTIVQDFCGKMGLPVPSALIGVTESSVVQYRALMKDLVYELAEFNWQQQSVRATWVSTAAEDQGSLFDLFGADYHSLVPGSIWDETEKRPIFGPVGDASWEMYKAFVNPGPVYQYRIAQNRFLINPEMPAGHTIGAVYMTGYGITDETGAVSKPVFTVDSDLVIYPDNVVRKSLEWRWKKIKGEPWVDDFAEYRTLLARNKAKDANMQTLYLDGPNMGANFVPGIWVPAGGVV